MYFFQKIYFNDKPLILTTDKEAYFVNDPGAAGYVSFDGASQQSYSRALQALERPGTFGALIEDVSDLALLDQLHAMYHPIDAGGGVVFNEKDEVLMIYRRGKWDLPKGKLDDGEDIAVCALREVSEETGLKDLSLTEKLCETYHIYTQNNENLLKHTVWYTMKGSSADKLKPQKEENILEARWVERGAIAPLAARSYVAIRDVLHAAGIRW